MKYRKFLSKFKKDMQTVKFEEEIVNGEKYIKLGVGKFFFKRKASVDYENSVKKLFEDFMTNTSSYYIRNFWEL